MSFNCDVIRDALCSLANNRDQVLQNRVGRIVGRKQGSLVCFKQFYDQTFVGHLGDDMFHQLICLRAFAGS